MLAEINDLPDSARLWIYQAERKLTDTEVDQVKSSTAKFLTDWTAHGANLRAAFVVPHDQFLVIALDEQVGAASGCSIDASVHHVQKLQSELGVSLLNNSKVAFDLGEYISLMATNEIRTKVSDKVLQPDTKVFDNTVKNLGEFRSRWLVESGKTWINRYFN